MTPSAEIDLSKLYHPFKEKINREFSDPFPFDDKHLTIMPTEDVITERWMAYLRLHGRDPKDFLTGKTVAEHFQYDSLDEEVGEIAERMRHLAAETDEVHVVFDNSGDFAPKAAKRLRRLGQTGRDR